MKLSEFRDKFVGELDSIILEDINQRLGEAMCPGTSAGEPSTTEEEVPTVVRPTRRGRTASQHDESCVPAPTPSTRATRGGQQMVTETPRATILGVKATPRLPGVPGTMVAATPVMGTVRAPKMGEIVYSQNGSRDAAGYFHVTVRVLTCFARMLDVRAGSPIGSFAGDSVLPTPVATLPGPRAAVAATPSITAVVPPPSTGRGTRGRKAQQPMQPAAAAITLTTEDGRAIDLNKKLSKADRAMAAGQLEGLQAQVQALMSRLAN
eukprot:1038475-Prorocentrum_minimum.AAC.3